MFSTRRTLLTLRSCAGQQQQQQQQQQQRQRLVSVAQEWTAASVVATRCLSGLVSVPWSSYSYSASSYNDRRSGDSMGARRTKQEHRFEISAAMLPSRRGFSTTVASFPAPNYYALLSTSSQPFRSLSTQAEMVEEGAVLLSSDRKRKPPIRILYASQGGTAQIFAQQLAGALEDEYNSMNGDNDGNDIPAITIEGWHEYPNKDPSRLLTPGEAVHVFLASVTGVGEPPDNGRAFYDYFMNNNTDFSQLEYTVFGLGNSKAHPNHYNVIGIRLDKRLEELGAQRIHPLGLGDDGDCLEDDFDNWMEDFLTRIRTMHKVGGDEVDDVESGNDDSPAEAISNIDDATALSTVVEEIIPTHPCLAGVLAKPSSDTDSIPHVRRVSAKFPKLRLDVPTGDVVRHDLLDHHGFYDPSTTRAKITKSRSLSAYGGESGLREIRLDCSALSTTLSPDGSTYITGDHCLVYPRNSGCMVEAYLRQLDVHPHAIIQGREDGGDTYPFPVGLTVYETLSHCVDLGAIPSPSFSRFLLGRRELDYKQEIAIPRRTILDLLLSSNNKNVGISLEDLLFQCTPIKPRHYSIASSNLASPNEICLTFRPIKYMTSKGHLREGICTNYMSSMVAMDDDLVNHYHDEAHTQYMPVYVASNPTFRLPQDPKISILLIAGGCGVAPIRAFVQERLHLAKTQKMVNGDQDFFGQGLMYLGFRSPEDEVHRSLIDKALELGGLTDAKIAYSSGCTDESQQYCMNVNKLVRKESTRVWDHLESGGYTYLCGGARTFGAAIEQELLEIIQEHGNMDFESAELYLKQLLDSKRLMEDLAD